MTNPFNNLSTEDLKTAFCELKPLSHKQYIYPTFKLVCEALAVRLTLTEMSELAAPFYSNFSR